MNHRRLSLAVGTVALLGMLTGCAEVHGVTAATPHPMVDFALDREAAPTRAELHVSHFGFEFTPRSEMLFVMRPTMGTAVSHPDKHECP